MLFNMSSQIKKGAILQTYGEPKPKDVRDAFIGRFVAEAAKKFDAGQAEHDGRKDKCNLIENVDFKKQREEIIDQWFYTLSLELKYQKLQAKCKELQAKCEELERRLKEK